MRYILMATALLALAATTSAAKTTGRVKQPGIWAQSYTDRAADPAIRFGQLPNGLRYAVLHNATPPGQMALRLYIGSGSLAETDAQQGLAHFLEHIAFRGSTHAADGEMMRVLARKGLGLGADTNAATSQESTVFQFDFPHADRDSIDTGLTMFREIASELTISQAAVDAERGVILSEERLRDSAGYRASKGEVGLLLDGQLAPRRWPIGLVDVIKSAPAAQLRAFYEAHYRPDNAVVVAVGDFDATAMEAQIKARFSDWKAKTAASPAPALGIVAKRGETVRVSTEAAAPPAMLVAWVRPYDDSADSDARERRDTVRVVAQLIFNQRIADLSRQPKPPFLDGGVDRENLLKSADATTLSVSAAPSAQLSALRAIVDEQRRASAYGVTKSEIARVVARLEAALGTAAAGGTSRMSPRIADKIVDDASENEVTRSPQQDLADVRRWTKDLSKAEVNAALKDLFRGAGPLVFLSTPVAPTGGVAAVRSTLAAAMTDKLASGTGSVASTWPYGHFGKPATVTAIREVADLGLTVVTLSNGTHLTVKPTTFAKDQILVDVSAGTGRLGLPGALARSYWMVGGPAPVFVEGGTGKLSFGEIERLLADRVTGVRLATSERAFELSGRTRPQDLATEMQLLAAYANDPGYRVDAVERSRVGLSNALPQIEGSPEGVLQREVPRLLRSGDGRWTDIPSIAALAQSKPDDLPKLVGPALAGPLDVTIVGDVSVAQAIEVVASTLGAVTPQPEQPAPLVSAVRFPDANAQPLVLRHRGRADQAIALQAWATNGFYASPSDASALVVAAGIIQNRLFDQLRETDGATYSPGVGANASDTVDGYGYLLAQVELPPAKIPMFRARLNAIVADLAAKPVSDDELDRARHPLVEARLRDRQTNEYWIAVLPRAEREERRLAAIRDRAERVQRVSAADVRAVLARYVAGKRPFQIDIVRDPAP